MVSFFSLFSSLRKKKKAKRGSISTPASPSNPTSPSQTQSKARFFSLRSRSSARPSLPPRRSSSNDSLRRRKDQVQVQERGQRQEKLELPKLDFEVQAPNESEGSPLGLESVGRRPILRTNEVVVLQGLKLSVQEVAQGWKCFGKALKGYGVQEPGILLPRHSQGEEDAQRYLLALFVLSIRPAMAAQFPSITSSFPTTPTIDTTTNTASQNADTASSNAWSERLQLALNDRPNPHDLAEILKFLLRRVIPPDTPAKPTPRLDTSPGVLAKTTAPLDTTTYTTFVRAEFATSYPLDSYGTLLRPKLDNDLASFLEDVFDIWAGIVAYSDVNGMTAGRICLLLGGWVWGSRPDERQQQQGWKALYDDWLVAASRVEHLFYAWIRWQSTLQTLPINLIQLVKDYPFGESSASSDRLPSPPPSSFARQTLHVTLASERPLDKARLVPREIIRLALPCHAASDTPLWTSITRTGHDARVKTVGEFLSDDSTRVLQTDQPEPVKDHDMTTPDHSARPNATAKDEESFYRPFSSIARRPLDLSDSHHRSLSSLSGSSPSNHRDSYIPQQSPTHLNGEASSSDLQSGADAPAWNDFEQIGFGDSPIATELLLSPPVSLSKVDRPARINQDTIRQKPTSPDRPVIPASLDGYSIISEEVVNIDDMFLPYVEDGQLDSYATKAWPPFALIRLDSPVQSSAGSGNSHSFKWLLVTIEYRPPPTPVPAAEDTHWLPRPTSPGAASNTSRMSSFSFRDFSANFRRSSSYGVKQGGFRRSLLGTSSRTLSNDASPGLKPLPQLAPVDLGLPVLTSASAKAPTQITDAEMGDIVKKPRSSMNALVETRGDDQIQGAQVSEDTVSGDWHYKAEGGAHLIFGYTGSSPAYRGKVLRIRKVSAAGDDAQMAVADEWRDRLLPKLVPSHLLVPAHAVTLSFTFVHELMLSASGVRPAWRKKDQSTAEEDVRAWLLEDLSAVDQGGNNRRTLSIEIKPKWGFLPSPAFLHPPESVPIKSRISRFVMHQHLRDATNSEGKSYDPLDLYSGDEERMQRSLDGLFAGWKSTEGKGNNFRLSVDGVTVFPGQTALLPVSTPEELLSALSGPLILSLQSSGALRILRDLQSSLDATDISDLAHRFHLAHPDSDLFDPSLLPDPTPEELSDFVDLYLSAPADGVTEDRWTLRQRLIAYTMSAIFKDCSIFVTIPFTYSGNQLVSTQGDSKVRLIDLDMKPISSLRKWYDLDDQIWRHWLSTHTDGDQSSATIAEPNTPRPLNVNSLDVIGLSPKKASFSPSPERSLLGTPLSTSRPDEMADIASPSDTLYMFSHPAENRDIKGPVTDDALANSPAHGFFGQESARDDTEESSRYDDETGREPRMRRSPAPSPSPRPEASGDLTEDLLEPEQGGANSETQKVQESNVESSQPYLNGTHDEMEHFEETCRRHNLPTPGPGPTSPFTLLRSSDQVTLAHSTPNPVHVDSGPAEATSSDSDARLTVEHRTQ